MRSPLSERGGGRLRKFDAVFGRGGSLFRKGPSGPLIKTARSPPLLRDPPISRGDQKLIWRAARYSVEGLRGRGFGFRRPAIDGPSRSRNETFREKEKRGYFDKSSRLSWARFRGDVALTRFFSSYALIRGLTRLVFLYWTVARCLPLTPRFLRGDRLSLVRLRPLL